MPERTSPADRWRRVSTTFRGVVDRVAPGEWDAPSPCEGWAARDVLAHLVEWVPPFLSVADQVEVADTAGLDDPLAWAAISESIQAALDDPVVASSPFRHARAGDHRLEDAVDRFITSDVLVHSWDLATAVGVGVDLDPEVVETMLEGFAAMPEDALVASGQFGPRVPVAEDAPAPTRLLAVMGRSVPGA